MMAVVVEVCEAFGLDISEKKTESMPMPVPNSPIVTARVEEGGQRYPHANHFI